MLHKGECFCTECGKRFKTYEALFKAKLPIHNIEYDVFCALNHKNPDLLQSVSDIRNNKKYDLIGTPIIKKESGEVKSIEVKVKHTDTESPVTIRSDNTNRYCPYCFEDKIETKVHEMMGYTDSFLVSMVGLRDVGKTCMVESICSRNGISKLANYLDKTKRTVCQTKQNKRISAATGINKLIITNYLQIRVTRWRKVTIYFGDVAGESFQQKEENGGNTDFQVKLENMLLDNSDGGIFLHDERDWNCKDLDIRQYRYYAGYEEIYNDDSYESEQSDLKSDKRSEGVSNRISILYDSFIDKGIPTLCVLTKGDELKEFVINHGNVLKPKDGNIIVTSKSPVFNSATDGYKLPFDKETEAVVLAQHMACANDVMRELVQGEIQIRDDTPCFIISSGIKEGDTIHYDKSCNVLLPLLYLMRKWF